MSSRKSLFASLNRFFSAEQNVKPALALSDVDFHHLNITTRSRRGLGWNVHGLTQELAAFVRLPFCAAVLKFGWPCEDLTFLRFLIRPSMVSGPGPPKTRAARQAR